MLDSQQIQSFRTIIRPLLALCDASCKVPPFNHDLYQACVDEAVRRGYPVDGNPSVRTYLRETVFWTTTLYGYLDRPTQMWLALNAASAYYIDDASVRFPSAMPNIYLFNNRFIGRQQQGDRLLDVYADTLHQVPTLFQPVPSNLIITSNMNFVTGCLLEYETRSTQHCSAAQRYSDYQRERTAVAEACAYYAFPRGIPLTEYVQAIPHVMLFIATVNDVLSFYKEELVGESTNQISILAAQSKKSKFEILDEMVETSVGNYKDITKILEGSLEACGTFKRFAVGYISYHLTSERYKLVDLDL